MLRTLLILVGLPIASMLAFLAFRAAEPRVDFVVHSDELRTIDPQKVSFLDEIQVANAIFEGLTRLNPATMLPEPGCAERWTISADGTRYEFKLREGLRWSNGDPLVAEDFRAAWLRALDPALGAQYSPFLFLVAGGEAYYQARRSGSAGDASKIGLRAPDDHTFVVTLAAPCPYFLDLTSFPTLVPLHRPTIERFAYRDGRVLERSFEWTRPENMVSNGAFTLERWDFKRRLVLKRNPTYWDPSAIHVERIEIAIMSPKAALLAYETGGVDLVRGLEPDDARVMRAEAAAGRRSDFHTGPRLATFFLRVNCTKPPLDDARVRQALSVAIDRAAICESVLGVGETPAYSFVPPAMSKLVGYQPPAGLGAVEENGTIVAEPRDERIRRARALLEAAGYDATRPLRLAYASDPPQQRFILQAVAAMWERDLGIRVELEVTERKVLSERIRALDYDIARSDWFGDYLDPSTFLDLFVAGSSQNRTGWSHEEYTALIRAAASEPGAAARFAKLREAETILVRDELPIIPIYFRTGNFLLRPRFTGLSDNLRDILPIHRVLPE
ncbi:MAG: peptide ABC transporter substrate-binding protein [Phycisphaerales bacterium]|nr:peptide ABC transporter substrate-binding protein [Phycisphaerales bacterium]